MLDKGAEPCVAHVVFPTGETLDVKVPLRYRLNSLGRETVIIGGNLLFQKRLEIDIEHLARFQWGEAHKWDQGTMGIWWEAAGITDTSKPVDDETIERLHEAFPKTSLRGIVDRYRAQHYGHPTPSIYTLINLALKANRPLTDQRPSKSGIAIEFKDNEYGRMGIARDKRTGQTWMWPPEEENDANEEFGVAPDDKADAFVSYRTVDGRRKTIKEMIEDIDDAEKKLGYSPTCQARPPEEWSTDSTATRPIGSKDSTGGTSDGRSRKNSNAADCPRASTIPAIRTKARSGAIGTAPRTARRSC